MWAHKGGLCVWSCDKARVGLRHLQRTKADSIWEACSQRSLPGSSLCARGKASPSKPRLSLTDRHYHCKRYIFDISIFISMQMSRPVLPTWSTWRSNICWNMPLWRFSTVTLMFPCLHSLFCMRRSLRPKQAKKPKPLLMLQKNR